MNKSIALSKGRNYGIDLLRIVSMLMVVILHVLGQGGILKTAETLSAQYEIAWFLEILCYCAVNCYALISGYVGVEANYKYSNIAYIWLQVVFYGAGIAFIGALISPKIYLNAVFEGITPVSHNLYWYFTAYFCVFLFIPALNKLLNALNEKQLKVLGITIFLLFSILQIVAAKEIFYTNRGYSALWLALLYMLGGIMKKTNLFKNISSKALVAIFFGSAAITWAEKFVVEKINMASGTDELKNALVSYISPTIVLCAVMLVAVFSRLNVTGILRKITIFLAPLSFGVYLIHVQKQVWRYLLKDSFEGYAQMHWAVLPFAVIGAALAIFIVCALIDYLRDRIFKLLKIKELLLKLENKFLGKVWE